MEQENQVNEAVESQVSPSGTGPFVGAIIIILLMAAGAFYFWNSKSDSANNNPPPLILGNDTEAEVPSNDPASGLPQQQTSDSPESINADIQAMNFDQFNSQNDVSLQGFQQSAQ